MFADVNIGVTVADKNKGTKLKSGNRAARHKTGKPRQHGHKHTFAAVVWDSSVLLKARRSLSGSIVPGRKETTKLGGCHLMTGRQEESCLGTGRA